MATKTPASEAKRHLASNIECAHIILASEAKYGGPGSLAAQWARAYMERAQPMIKGPLFKAA
jgi:hypothetical protein